MGVTSPQALHIYISGIGSQYLPYETSAFAERICLDGVADRRQMLRKCCFWHWRHGYVPCTVMQLERRHRIHSRSRLSGAKMHARSGPAISFFFVTTHRSLHWRHNILCITSSVHRNQYYAAPVNVLRFRYRVRELRHFCYCGWVYSVRWAPTWAEHFPFQLLFLCRLFLYRIKNFTSVAFTSQSKVKKKAIIMCVIYAQ